MGNGNQKTVVITGGSRGIGRSVALRFAEDRPRIIIAHYDPDEVDDSSFERDLKSIIFQLSDPYKS